MMHYDPGSDLATSSAIKETIKRYLEEMFLFSFNDEITETSDLFQLGLLDSFGYIQLLHYLEDEFQITFSEEEMLSNVLVSHANIVNSVWQKVARQQQTGT